MASNKLLLGFHAVTARLRVDAQSITSIYYEASRRDQRMQTFLALAEQQGVRLHPANESRLHGLAGGQRHQGVVALASEVHLALNIDELLDGIEGDALLLVLDGVTDPHNLGACLRVANGAGAHGVIAPRDRAVSVNATVAKVASGATETTPYLMVTNLARTLRSLQDRGIFLVGTDDEAEQDIYQANLQGPLALVMGAEGEGMRRLTRETCDQLVRIPMQGAVASLNVSVASGVCLYEVQRQRRAKI